MTYDTDRKDRRVHARIATTAGALEIVRYSVAGRWYVEPTDGGRRRSLTLPDAAKLAKSWRRCGGDVFTGVEGGSIFDLRVREAMAS